MPKRESAFCTTVCSFSPLDVRNQPPNPSSSGVRTLAFATSM
ncbi:hypothetical protein ACFQRB_19515 [Halobaculum litoreum]|uniref:Uncharacterized protein n=1 Tax=Halobaculum litoreum TaxID=3031998 RepID=A0ABD5XXY5_9EURY